MEYDAWRRWSIAALTILYLQIWLHPVPHARDASAIEPGLMAQMRGLDGAMVLLENTPHRDMDADPARDIEPAPVPVHFESVVPRLTGLRLYAGMWDGWQWCPQRDESSRVVHSAARLISVTRPEAVHAELSRWGVDTCSSGAGQPVSSSTPILCSFAAGRPIRGHITSSRRPILATS